MLRPERTPKDKPDCKSASVANSNQYSGRQKNAGYFFAVTINEANHDSGISMRRLRGVE
jgi:hypothetical protein